MKNHILAALRQELEAWEKVLISLNDEIVHGIPGARAIADGDLVKLDVTIEKDGYVTDAARTVVA